MPEPPEVRQVLPIAKQPEDRLMPLAKVEEAVVPCTSRLPATARPRAKVEVAVVKVK